MEREKHLKEMAQLGRIAAEEKLADVTRERDALNRERTLFVKELEQARYDLARKNIEYNGAKFTADQAAAEVEKLRKRLGQEHDARVAAQAENEKWIALSTAEEGPHRGPADCPTYDAGCHCTVETLVHNITRANAAEKLRAERHKKIIEYDEALHKKTVEYEALRINNDHALAELQRLQKDLKVTLKENGTLRDERDEWRKTFDLERKIHHEVRAEREAARAEAKRFEQERNSAYQKIASLKEELVRLCNFAAAEEEKLRKQVGNLQAALDLSRAGDTEALQTKLDMANKALAKVREDNKSLWHKTQELHRALIRAKTERDNEIWRLQQERDATLVDLNFLREQAKPPACRCCCCKEKP